MVPRNTIGRLLKLLLEGQRVDWRYSVVTVLVIGGLICTPLILGSIRDRAYQVHKREIEISNNVREILVRSAGERAKVKFDDDLVRRISTAIPGVAALGNYSFVLDAKGPEQRYSVRAVKSLYPADPRIDVFQIETSKSAGLGLRDVIVSDELGRVLYGPKGWEAAWRDGGFTGPAMDLVINDEQLSQGFSIVGRQRRPGRTLFISPSLGGELRRNSVGYGSAELGLRPNKELMQLALPKIHTSACLIKLPVETTCPHQQRSLLVDDLKGRLYGVSDGAKIDRLSIGSDSVTLGVRLMHSRRTSTGEVVEASFAGDCEELLKPLLVTRCPSALVLPDIVARVAVRAAGDREITEAASVVGLTSRLFDDLREHLDLEPASPEMTPNSLESGEVVNVIAPRSSGLTLDESLELIAGAVPIPARVAGLYPCQDDCLWLADVESTFRLINIADGAVEISSRAPLVLRPVRKDVDYDEILVFARSIEEIRPVAASLETLLGDDYRVLPNLTEIFKLERDNARLTAVFQVTVAFAIVFLLLSLGALSKINIDRRSRQMAQLLILGFSRWFVRILVVCEYLLITLLAALFALAVSSGLCSTLRELLRSGYLSEGSTATDPSFVRVVNAMQIDPAVFLMITTGAVACAMIVAAGVAYIASYADPVELLD